MKKIIKNIIHSFLVSYALTVSPNFLSQNMFEEKMDFLTYSFGELLGNYNPAFILLWVLFFALLYFTERRPKQESSYTFGISGTVISVCFGFFAGIGRFYLNYGINGENLFSLSNLLINIAGYSLILYTTGKIFFTICNKNKNILFSDNMVDCQTSNQQSESKCFWAKGNVFLKSYILLWIFYLPFLILSFPGGLCYDGLGQIEQVLNSNYTKHHPLAHTLIMGGLTKLGKDVFGSPEIGVFFYIVLQTALILAAFALSIKILSDRKVKGRYLWIILLLYMFTPLYTNLTTTAIKDVPFGAFTLIYVILFALIATDTELLYKPKFHVFFVLSQAALILFRNNGLPMVVISGLFATILLWNKERKNKLIIPAGLFLEGTLLGLLITFILTVCTGAAAGSKGEILSLPFQQTAYTLSIAGDSFSEGEIKAIEGVLGDADTIADSYDPLIADTVKMYYDTSTGLKENVTYIGAYLLGGIKHPLAYTKAFLVHVYGWFAFTVPNEIRYEVDYNEIKQGLLFPGAEKVMIFLYRFAGRFTPLGFLENCGVYTFGLSLLSLLLVKEKRKKLVSATLPLWTSLLICMASPCFFGHPRYALPIIISLPFLMCFGINEVKTCKE